MNADERYLRANIARCKHEIAGHQYSAKVYAQKVGVIERKIAKLEGDKQNLVGAIRIVEQRIASTERELASFIAKLGT